jgi:hypothetical protein
MKKLRRLYLDSRDLIDLVSTSSPIPPKKIANVLRDNYWAVVYSFSNVCETAIPEDLEETKRRALLLKSLPHAFIRGMPPIRCMEFKAATRAFESQVEPAAINPYVEHWYQTFLYRAQDREMKRAARFRFEDQVVFMVANNPDLCRNLPAHTAKVQQAVEEDREVSDPVRRNRQRFEGGVAVALADCGLPMPMAGKKELAHWIRENPTRCPSWRLFDEGYLKFASNVSDSVDHGDMNDWSHVSSLPYVDAITLDRRIASYARAAADNLKRLNPACTYAERIFKNTEEWLKAVASPNLAWRRLSC